jgi:hypothetical protein
MTDYPWPSCCNGRAFLFQTNSDQKEFTVFLARDKNNDLYLFDKLPIKGSECWWAESGVDGTYLRLDKSLYPEVTWESDPVPAQLSVLSEKNK